MSTTREVAERIVAICEPGAGAWTLNQLIDAIDQALQAERERCVKTVEAHLNCAEEGASCAKRIVRAIREGKPRE